jgi:BolA protein
MQQHIETTLADALKPGFLAVENESHMHGGAGTETHYKVTCASAEFDGLSRVKRHQMVYQLLAQPLATGVHALALHLYDLNEWETAEVPASPDCLGGSKS